MARTEGDGRGDGGSPLGVHGSDGLVATDQEASVPGKV